MDRRGGCCIARYGYGGGEYYDMSKVDKIMLRFRPIAPKPVNGGGSVSGGSTPESGEGYFKRGGRGRGKRQRCVKPRCNSNNKNNNNKRKRSPKASSDVEKTVVTLPLLPESPEPKSSEKERSSATWLSFDDKVAGVNVMQQRPGRVGGSCVTVDCVTDTWVEGDGLGCTDEERRMNLERDTCPGFVSDVAGRVVWTNGAYKSMVMGKDGKDDEVVVWLVMKERAAVEVGVMSNYTAAFTCRVRVQHHQYASGCGGSTASSQAKEWSSLTLPCDVWRMEGGGFAWRLDVKAALCLGRYGTCKAV